MGGGEGSGLLLGRSFRPGGGGPTGGVNLVKYFSPGLFV